jgi:hypothetical protein
MRPLPSMINKVAKRLDEPADDVNGLAKEIVALIYEAWEKQGHYIVVVTEPSGLWHAWGPYATVKEAHKSIGDPIIACREGARGVLLKLHKDVQLFLEEEVGDG